MHDSFILHHGLENELNEAMGAAFSEEFEGLKCKVDLKYRSIENRMEKKDSETEICDMPLRDLLQTDSDYGNYFHLLHQHWQYAQGQGFRSDEDA